MPLPPMRFPFRRLISDSRYALIVNVLCAIFVTFVISTPRYFLNNLLASTCVGTIAFLIIDGGRLLLWGEEERPKWLGFIALIAVAAPIAQLAGMALTRWLLGQASPDMFNIGSPTALRLLAFTLVTTGAVTLYFTSRDRVIRAEAEAAHAKARAEVVERQALQAQLQVLQAQVEPHMLFNTLANVQGLIALDPMRAQHMLDLLIQYLRNTLSATRADSTTLGQEFASLEAYLGLMAVRMGGRLGFELELPAALRQVALPPMLLQPLVENAIRHGIEPNIEGGRITVGAARDGDRLTLTVADTGLGLDAPGPNPGTRLGLANIRERLLALHGQRASLTLEAGMSGGAVARVTIPTGTP